MLLIKRTLGSVPVAFHSKPAEAKGSKLATGLFLASLITGANWYFQNQWANIDIEKQQQIINRVSSEKTLETYEELNGSPTEGDFEGCRLQVKGELQPGRFVIKRNRGEQEGYLVLAPFIIDKDIFTLRPYGRTLNTKLMLNLGWVPKESKHKIKETAAIDILEFDELPEQMADDEYAPVTSTVTAFVRRGEERDLLRGYNNWKNQDLYKFIDLDLMANVFGNPNITSRYFYLDRIAEEGAEESFPFPNNNETYIQEIRNNKKAIENRRETYSFGVGLASFASAILFAAI